MSGGTQAEGVASATEADSTGSFDVGFLIAGAFGFVGTALALFSTPPKCPPGDGSPQRVPALTPETSGG